MVDGLEFVFGELCMRAARSARGQRDETRIRLQY